MHYLLNEGEAVAAKVSTQFGRLEVFRNQKLLKTLQKYRATEYNKRSDRSAKDIFTGDT